MKTSTRSLLLPTLAEQIDAATLRGVDEPATRARVVAPAFPERTSAWDGAGSRSLRIVGILAFCQSLVFLILWLFLCAWAGAAAVPPAAEFDPQLQLSKYQPLQERDPFLPAGAKPAGAGEVAVTASPTTPLVFVLQGILCSGSDSSAMVNDQMLTLNHPATITVGPTTVTVTAVEITRDRVVLTAAGQRFELRLGTAEPSAATAKH